MHDIATGLDNGKQIDADFTKAFDKVTHRCLYQRLHYYGIRGTVLDWIDNILTNRSQQVVLDGCFSDTLPVTSGIPQGTVLGPLLFLCFVNNIPQHVSNKIRLYADDILLYKVIDNEDDCIDLQKDLDGLQQWENTWQMHFNPPKCQLIRFSNKHNIIRYNYKIRNEILKETSSLKYFGVHIDQNLTWKEHVNTITNRANRVRGLLQRNFRRSPAEIKIKCYQTLIQPILGYALDVWSPYHIGLINQLESVHRRAARFIFQDYRRTSSITNMLHILQWPTLEKKRVASRAIMIFKIINGLIDIPIESPIFTSNNLLTRGHQQKFIQLPTRTDVYLNSFSPHAIRIWNSLPPSITKCTIDQFKQQIQSQIT